MWFAFAKKFVSYVKLWRELMSRPQFVGYGLGVTPWLGKRSTVTRDLVSYVEAPES